MYRANCGSSLVACLLLGLWACSIGCNRKNPGTWSADKVAAHLSEQLQASDVQLESTPSGFTGTGMRADGETLTIVVAQDPANQEFRWDVKGDRGFVEDGSYGFVTEK